MNALSGLSGLFPIHPKTYIRAKDNRETLAQQVAALAAAAASEAEAKAKAKSESSESEVKNEDSEAKQ